MQYLLIDNNRRNNAISYINSLDLQRNYEVIIRPYKKNRTRTQNNTMWMWYDPIAEYTGYTPEELHELFKGEFIGYEFYKYNGFSYLKPKTSTTLTVKGMAIFLEKVMAVANFLELRLPMPDDYNLN